MNEDQVKGTLKSIAGKLQKEPIKLFSSTDQQVKGLMNQAKGKVQHHTGNLKVAVKNATKKP